MARLSKISPLGLYLIGVGCFIVSRVFIGRMEIVNYAFALIGAIFIILGIRKYLIQK